MPDPRNVVRLEGVHEARATYKADGTTITYDATKPGGSAAVGLAATLSADDTVALCADGDAIVGKVVGVEFDGTVSIQDEGYATLPGGQGATLTRGTAIVGALGPASAKGYIRSAASATAAELIKCRGIITNAGTPAATVVKF